MKANCILSLVLCSRNDNYQGNSLWRLQTTINYLAESFFAINSKYQIEVLVADWGSEIPLQKDLLLLKEAAEITRFIEISPQFARKSQVDSPFAEVLALNIAIRRAKGEYIGRIDQDTLVTTSFFRIFFSLYNATIKTKFSLDSSFFFVERHGIPYSFSRLTPHFHAVKRFIGLFRNYLPTDGPHITPWFDRPVGIVFMHRNLWLEAKGYDESLLYWGWMETDLAYRLHQKYQLVNLQYLMKKGFFHLEHKAWRLPKIHRKKNIRKKGQLFAPNDCSWGFSNNDIPIYSYQRQQYFAKNNPLKCKDNLPLIKGAVGVVSAIILNLFLKMYGGVLNIKRFFCSN